MTPSDPNIPKNFRCGFIAICGPPNAGKSTLTNYLLEQKISITSNKPQTTRDRILGIVNRPRAQLVLVDTPGIFKAKGQLNTRIVRSALSAITDVDVVLLLIDAARPPHKDGEALSLQKIQHVDKPVVLALNKIDCVKKPKLLELIDRWRAVHDFKAIIPISAKLGTQTQDLMMALESLLPPGDPMFPEEMLTDVSQRFLASEMIREKVFRLTGQEIPYSTAVTIDSFKEKKGGKTIYIQATIHVERDSQKGIIIGKKGARLKQIGAESRLDIERMTGATVFLELFVRVQKKWGSDPRILTEFGYS